MFDRQVSQHAGLLDRIAHDNFHRHVAHVITVDVSQTGWASGGTSSGIAGQFDVEGNGLIILPTWMRASDLTISPPSSTSSRLNPQAMIFVFMNTKQNPGIPMSIDSSGHFGVNDGFTSICCSFNKFFVYVATPQAGQVIQLGVLKGLALNGCGGTNLASDANIKGCY